MSPSVPVRKYDTSETAFDLPIHKYTRFNDSRSIRIIQLHPSRDPTRPLKCNLIPRLLEDHTMPYEAISYACGEYNPTVSLEINEDSRLLITENLADILKRFRLSDKTRNLWVDAISIDQFNDIEKEQQVAMMRDIYPKASEVLVWLGKEDELTARAYELCREIASNSAAYGVEAVYPWHFLPDSKPDVLAKMTQLAHDTTRGRCLVSLFSRLYFSRRWIVQEIILGQKLSFNCGMHFMDWAVFSTTVAVLRQISFRVQDKQNWLATTGGIDSIPCYMTSWPIITTRHMRTAMKALPGHFLKSYPLANPRESTMIVRVQEETPSNERGTTTSESRTRHMEERGVEIEHHVGNPQGDVSSYERRRPANTLLGLVKTFELTRVRDPRDSLYALLGVAEDDVLFQPNYRESAHDTFRRFARKILLQDQSLSILHYVRGGECPSYAPDWRVDAKHGNLGGFFGWKFCSGLHYNPDVRAADNEHDVLIAGTRVDTIVDLLEPGDSRTRPADILSTRTDDDIDTYRVLESIQFIIDTVTTLVEHFSASNQNPANTFTYKRTNESIFHAIVRTLLLDNRLPALWPIIPRKTTVTAADPLFAAVLQVMAEIAFTFQRTRKTRLGADTRAMQLYIVAMRATVARRKFIVTSQGYIGLGPDHARVGDEVVIFKGGETPFILRQINVTSNSTTSEPTTSTPPRVPAGDGFVVIAEPKITCGPTDSHGDSTGAAEPILKIRPDTRQEEDDEDNQESKPPAHLLKYQLIGESYLHGFMDKVDLDDEEGAYFTLV